MFVMSAIRLQNFYDTAFVLLKVYKEKKDQNKKG